MTGNTDTVRYVIEDRRDSAQNVPHIRLNMGRADHKHRAVGTIDNLDAQPVIGGINQKMRFQFIQTRIFENGLLQVLFQFLKTTGFILSLLLLHAVRVRQGITIFINDIFAAARNRVGGIPGFCSRINGGFQRRAEVFRDLRQLLRAGDRNQPHHQEERHHGGHKVCVSNLP